MKKHNGITDIDDMMNAFMKDIINSDFGFYFSHIQNKSENLGNGYELIPIELKDKNAMRYKYSHLYFNGIKVTDKVFRKGGLGGTFQDGYVTLIYYKVDKSTKTGFDSGTHVIINTNGDICLSETGLTNYPYHCGKNVGKIKDTYFNLKTGKEIITCYSSDYINGENFIILEHRYDWYNKSLELGIYRINKDTCEFEKIDDIKK